MMLPELDRLVKIRADDVLTISSDGDDGHASFKVAAAALKATFGTHVVHTTAALEVRRLCTGNAH